MKLMMINKLSSIIKNLKISKENRLLIREILKKAYDENLDPLHYDLKHRVLVPLEEKLTYTQNKMRHRVDDEIDAAWRNDDIRNYMKKELGFESKPTCKGFITRILMILKEK